MDYSVRTDTSLEMSYFDETFIGGEQLRNNQLEDFERHWEIEDFGLESPNLLPLRSTYNPNVDKSYGYNGDNEDVFSNGRNNSYTVQQNIYSGEMKTTDNIFCRNQLNLTTGIGFDSDQRKILQPVLMELGSTEQPTSLTSPHENVLSIQSGNFPAYRITSTQHHDNNAPENDWFEKLEVVPSSEVVDNNFEFDNNGFPIPPTQTQRFNPLEPVEYFSTGECNQIHQDNNWNPIGLSVKDDVTNDEDKDMKKRKKQEAARGHSKKYYDKKKDALENAIIECQIKTATYDKNKNAILKEKFHLMETLKHYSKESEKFNQTFDSIANTRGDLQQYGQKQKEIENAISNFKQYEVEYAKLPKKKDIPETEKKKVQCLKIKLAKAKHNAKNLTKLLEAQLQYTKMEFEIYKQEQQLKLIFDYQKWYSAVGSIVSSIQKDLG